MRKSLSPLLSTSLPPAPSPPPPSRLVPVPPPYPPITLPLLRHPLPRRVARSAAALPIGADTPRGVEANFSPLGGARSSSAASVRPSAGHPPPRQSPVALIEAACVRACVRLVVASVEFFFPSVVNVRANPRSRFSTFPRTRPKCRERKRDTGEPRRDDHDVDSVSEYVSLWPLRAPSSHLRRGRRTNVDAASRQIIKSIDATLWCDNENCATCASPARARSLPREGGAGLWMRDVFVSHVGVLPVCG